MSAGSPKHGWKKWLRRAALVLAGMGALYALAVACAYWAPMPDRLGSRPSTVVLYRDGSLAHVFLSPDDKWRVPVKLDDVDPRYVKALLSLEDSRFYWHSGVDPIAIARALATNTLRGRRVSGASTLTMQLVRVLEPRPRTWGSKLIEAARAFQLELRLSKKEILTAYLQHVPYGGNVEGVSSAAWAYFGHSAQGLSPSEIATLLAVPQHPGLRAPTPANAARLKDARDGIAERLLEDGALPLGSKDAPVSSEQVLEQVKAAPAPDHSTPFPREAPHAAYWMRAQQPNDDVIRTTLDRGVQRTAEQLVSRLADDYAQKNIHGTAAVVVDHRSGEVRALVGGFNFWSDEHGAQIAAFDVPRSPGSALKPFLYAEAIERGIANPDQLVVDVPISYGGYAPKNYDGGFSGLVRLEDALSKSLNVPFVNLLEQIGIEPFLSDLRGMGVKSLRDEPGYYGLSAVVGGVELTPLELSGLYATLARGGTYRPVHWKPSKDPDEPERIYAEGSAWLTQRALSLKDRPDFPARLRYTAVPRGIHWKTGTSFGNRDAWAAGSDAKNTAVVWMGNLDNTGTGALVGAEAAGPLLFDLLEAAGDRTGTPPDTVVPRDLAYVEVCAYSGHLPGPGCKDHKVVLARRSAVPTAVCPYHVQVEVETESGRALTPACHSGRNWELKTYLVWPASVRRWLREQHRLLPSPPAYAEGCVGGGPRKGPKIVSPADGQVALLLRGVDVTRQEIPLEADAEAHARLSWFVDGEYLGDGESEERLWWTPRPGKHEIVVSDETGLSSRRVIEVRQRIY